MSGRSPPLLILIYLLFSSVPYYYELLAMLFQRQHCSLVLSSPFLFNFFPVFYCVSVRIDSILALIFYSSCVGSRKLIQEIRVEYLASCKNLGRPHLFFIYFFLTASRKRSFYKLQTSAFRSKLLYTTSSKTAVDYSVCVCVCVFFLPIYSGHQVRWTYQPGSNRRKVTGFFIHLPSAVRALIFLARRIQPFLSLVDREVEFFVY